MAEEVLTLQRIVDAVAPLREALQADDADLEVVGVRDGVARLRLMLGSGCEECVLPRAMLEPMLLQRVRAADPSVSSVTLEDPRER